VWAYKQVRVGVSHISTQIIEMESVSEALECFDHQTQLQSEKIALNFETVRGSRHSMLNVWYEL